VGARLDRIGVMALADRFPPERDKTLSVFFRRMEDEACDLGARPHRL
jgi:hypothetical protein